MTRAAVAATVLFGAAALEAQRPTGTLNFGGNVNVSDVGAAGVVLDFDPQTVFTAGGNSGSFAPFVFGTLGLQQDFTAGSGNQNFDAFVTFGNFQFNLRFIPQGNQGQAECDNAPAVGQVCTPLQAPGMTVSPFNLANTASGNSNDPISSTASFNVVGTVFNVATPNLISRFVGTYSAVFTGESFQEVLASIESPSGRPDVSFAGRFVVTPIPEPSTYALMATGLVGILGAARLRRKNVS